MNALIRATSSSTRLNRRTSLINSRGLPVAERQTASGVVPRAAAYRSISSMMSCGACMAPNVPKVTLSRKCQSPRCRSADLRSNSRHDQRLP